MHFEGVLTKMYSSWDEHTKKVSYSLILDGEVLFLNDLLGRNIKVRHTGYECFHCGKNRKIKGMGYCFSCYDKVPQTNASVYKPELSTAHLGIAEKDLEFEQKLQLQPHVVYLADTGGLKVGVTRKSQIPTRWIDQGATHAIPIIETENRYEAGVLEVELAKKIPDKTKYKKMLLTFEPVIELLPEASHFQRELLEIQPQAKPIEPIEFYFSYPHTERYPKDIQSVTFPKLSEISGKLAGIKGQYWVLDNGFAFNVRSHEGYVVDIAI